MSEPREFPIVAGPRFKWDTHEPIVGPAPVRDTSVTPGLIHSTETCHPIPLRDTSFVDNYNVHLDESTGWQEVGWIDESYSFPAMSQIQQRMNERVRRAINQVMAPALIRKHNQYSISWRDPSPIEPAFGSDEILGERLRPTAVEQLIQQHRERYYSYATRHITGVDAVVYRDDETS